MVDEVKFKKGDIIRCIRGTSTTNYLILGKNYIVENYIKSIDMVVVQGFPDQWHSTRFVLVEQEFDYVKNPWWVKVKDEEEFNFLISFFKSKGLEISITQYLPAITILTNLNWKAEVSKYVVWSNPADFYKIVGKEFAKDKEIVVEFEKTVVLKNIITPKIKSQKDIEIEKIEKEMRNLADRLNKLKGD